MRHARSTRWAAALLAGGVLGASGGCGGSGEPVMTDEARAAQVQELKSQAAANDAAAKSASRPRPSAGVMPP